MVVDGAMRVSKRRVGVRNTRVVVILALSSSSASSVAAAGTNAVAGGRSDEPDMEEEDSSLVLVGMGDLVDMNELHHATPLVTQPRPMRRSEGSWLGRFGWFVGGGTDGGFGGAPVAGGGGGMEREGMEQEDTQGQFPSRLPRQRGMGTIMTWASCRYRWVMLGCIVCI